MSFLEKLFGKKNKKDDTDKIFMDQVINSQDIRDAMMGKNGKMVLMPGVLIDTMTMREISMRGASTNLTTIRGTAKSIQYFWQSRNTRMKTEFRHANLITLNIGEKHININKDNSLPVINENDDIEVMCVPTYSTDIIDALVVKNHTSGKLWCYSLRRASLGF